MKQLFLIVVLSLLLGGPIEYQMTGKTTYKFCRLPGQRWCSTLVEVPLTDGTSLMVRKTAWQLHATETVTIRR